MSSRQVSTASRLCHTTSRGRWPRVADSFQHSRSPRPSITVPSAARGPQSSCAIRSTCSRPSPTNRATRNCHRFNESGRRSPNGNRSAIPWPVGGPDGEGWSPSRRSVSTFRAWSDGRFLGLDRAPTGLVRSPVALMGCRAGSSTDPLGRRRVSFGSDKYTTNEHPGGREGDGTDFSGR